jgi:methylglutaconyl-CoA hydratase
METDVVLGAVDERGVATVTLNRPERNNAYNGAVIEALVDWFGRLRDDPQVRIVVLRGNGRHFQAGADLAWLKHCAGMPADFNHAFSTLTVNAMRDLQRFPKPTVALVHGGCFGGGVGLAAACDVVIATEDAMFALTEVRFGVIAAPVFVQLIGAMGFPALRRYGITAERFGAQEARRMGLVHELCPPGGLDAAAEPILDELLRNGPNAIAQSKRLTLELAGLSASDEVFAQLARQAANARSSAEAAEGLASFLEKRPPSWYQPKN